jgi:ATP-dependent helicase/nuclease subunit A
LRAANGVNWRIDESFPESVGAFIDWLAKDSGWTVEEEGRAVPIRPRHIAILSRRFRNFGADVTRPYIRALEARRIPHVLVGGRSFHDREEIIALRNAITAIEWPDDELTAIMHDAESFRTSIRRRRALAIRPAGSV